MFVHSKIEHWGAALQPVTQNTVALVRDKKNPNTVVPTGYKFNVWKNQPSKHTHTHTHTHTERERERERERDRQRERELNSIQFTNQLFFVFVFLPSITTDSLRST